MKNVRMAFAAFVALVLATAAQAADNKKLIVGKWEAVKVDEGTLQKGAVVEFKADGKMVVTSKKDGKDSSMDGSYVVDGDAFTITLKSEGKEFSMKIKIKKLTETEFDTVGDESKAVSFKRVK